ncbi:MAG: Uma2 family endonuclease, partial [Armatimonadetes bacterium]|nr:Uma2 family endonuclease [Armatimonadota bacterium]
WDALTADTRTPYPHLCPDFAVEVMSPSDRIGEAKAKMEEYRTNGATLGWLVDRKHRTVYVYRPNTPVETITDPASVSGDPELPGFVADLSRVFA